MVPPLSIFGTMRWRRRMSLPLSSTDTTHTSDEVFEQGEREVHAAQLGSWLSNVRRDAGSVRFLKCLRCIRAAADAIDADPERLSYATANCLITSTSYRCDSCEDTLEEGQPCVAVSINTCTEPMTNSHEKMLNRRLPTTPSRHPQPW